MKKKINIIICCLLLLLVTGCGKTKEIDKPTPKEETPKEIVEVKSGEGTNIGDEVCISKECFYVIESTENEVKLLSKYNLYVGGTYNSQTKEELVYEKGATGLQDEKMIGYHTEGDDKTYQGVTNYSDVSALYENSKVKKYVDTYVEYLKDEVEDKQQIVSGSILELDDMVNLGCTQSKGSYSCDNAPEWLRNTSFWIGTDYDQNDTVYYSALGTVGKTFYSSSKNYGVRPLITISLDLIK